MEVASPQAASSPQFVTVVLNLRAVGSTPDLVVEPIGLVFVTADGMAPEAQSIQISNLGSNPVTFTSTRSTEDGSDWFMQSPTEGSVFPTQPVEVDVQVDPSGLALGVFRGTLSFSFDNGTSAEVGLVLVVASNGGANLKQAAKYQNGCARTQLAAVFRLLGSGTSNPGGWPVPMEVEVADNCGGRMEQGSVVVEFANISSPEVALQHTQAGVWTGTWTPPNPDAETVVVVRVEATDSAGISGEFSSQLRVVPNADPPPRVNPGGIVHAASFVKDPLAPNTIISFFGTGLSEEPKERGQASLTVPLPTELAGTEITVAGLPVPLLFSREDQVNAILPFELTDRLHESLPVLVRRGLTVSSSELILISGARPGVFTQNQSGSGPGAVVDLGGAKVNEANPVSVGDAISIFATGLGEVAPGVPTGEAAPDDPLSFSTQDVEVTIDGVQAKVFFAGLAPRFVGLYQVNAEVPPGLPAGEADLVVSVGGQPSATVTVWVQ